MQLDCTKSRLSCLENKIYQTTFGWCVSWTQYSKEIFIIVHLQVCKHTKHTHTHTKAWLISTRLNQQQKNWLWHVLKCHLFFHFHSLVVSILQTVRLAANLFTTFSVRIRRLSVFWVKKLVTVRQRQDWQKVPLPTKGRAHTKHKRKPEDQKFFGVLMPMCVVFAMAYRKQLSMQFRGIGCTHCRFIDSKIQDF